MTIYEEETSTVNQRVAVDPPVISRRPRRIAVRSQRNICFYTPVSDHDLHFRAMQVREGRAVVRIHSLQRAGEESVPRGSHRLNSMCDAFFLDIHRVDHTGLIRLIERLVLHPTPETPPLLTQCLFSSCRRLNHHTSIIQW